MFIIKGVNIFPMQVEKVLVPVSYTHLSNWTVWEKTAKTHTNTSHSLGMLSTDDMVNWTYHGLIDVKALSPWGIASWAPSIVSRVESDGKTYAGCLLYTSYWDKTALR